MRAQGHQTVTRARTGRGIKSITEYYAVSESNTIPPTAWVVGTPPDFDGTKRFLWKYTETLYTDDTKTETNKVVISAAGDSGLTYRYSKHDKSGVSISSDGWGTSIPSYGDCNYLWNYARIVYPNGAIANTAPTSICETYLGDGSSIEDVTAYYAVTENKSEPDEEDYDTSIPELSSTYNKYLWCFLEVSYSAGDTTTTTPTIIAEYNGSEGFPTITQYYLATNVTKGATVYRNDNNPFYRDENGIGYLDVVLEEDMTVWYPTSGNNPPNAWICNETHEYSSDKSPSESADTRYWKRMNSLQPIVTAFILASKIKADVIDVDSLITKHIVVKDGGDNVIAAMGESANFPFYIGIPEPESSEPPINIHENPEKAITTIASDGTLTTTKLVANGGVIGGFIIDRTHLGTSYTPSNPFPNSNNYVEIEGVEPEPSASLYKTFIAFNYQDSRENVKACIGTNIAPSVLGYRVLANFLIDGASDSGNMMLGSQCVGLASAVKGYYNPYAWYCPEGVFAGLRPNIRTINNSDELTEFDCVIVVTSTAELTLPSSPKHGQFYMIIKARVATTNSEVTVSSDNANHPIYDTTSSSSVLSVSSNNDGDIFFLWYNANANIPYTTNKGAWYLTLK